MNTQPIPSAPPIELCNNYPYIPASYYQVQNIKPIVYAPYFIQPIISETTQVAPPVYQPNNSIKIKEKYCNKTCLRIFSRICCAFMVLCTIISVINVVIFKNRF